MPIQMPGKKTKIALGAFAGAGLALSTPMLLASTFAITAAGPVAGGTFASLQAAGYTFAGIQSLAMGGVTAGAVSTAAAGGSFLASKL